MRDWWNNRISKKLNLEYPFDFSTQDIDGVVRCHYTIDGEIFTRLILYESKNVREKTMGSSQLKTLQLIEKSIDWSKFDSFSGLFVLVIVDIDTSINWYKLDRTKVRNTTFDELYKIFSAKIIDKTLSKKVTNRIIQFPNKRDKNGQYLLF